MVLQKNLLLLAILFVCFIYLEMITPAGQFQSIIAKGTCFFTKGFQGKIGPLACEECYWSSHINYLKVSLKEELKDLTVYEKEIGKS
jgi:hypothetical protein